MALIPHRTIQTEHYTEIKKLSLQIIGLTGSSHVLWFICPHLSQIHLGISEITKHSMSWTSWILQKH